MQEPVKPMQEPLKPMQEPVKPMQEPAKPMQEPMIHGGMPLALAGPRGGGNISPTWGLASGLCQADPGGPELSQEEQSRAGPGMAKPSRAIPGPRQSGPSSGRAVGCGVTWGARAPNIKCFPLRGNHTVWGGWVGQGLQGLAPASRLQADLVLEALIQPENLREPPPRGEHVAGGNILPFSGQAAEAGQAEPAQAEPTRAEPSRARPGQADPSRAIHGPRQAGTELCRAELGQAEPVEVVPRGAHVAPTSNVSPHVAQGGK